MVLIPKKERRQILEHLFKEGVMCVKKDPRACRHNELEDIPNLHVMMVLRSLCSRAYVTEKFNWQWYYYFLTNEGNTIITCRFGMSSSSLCLHARGSFLTHITPSLKRCSRIWRRSFFGMRTIARTRGRRERRTWCDAWALEPLEPK